MTDDEEDPGSAAGDGCSLPAFMIALIIFLLLMILIG